MHVDTWYSLQTIRRNFVKFAHIPKSIDKDLMLQINIPPQSPQQHCTTNNTYHNIYQVIWQQNK